MKNVDLFLYGTFGCLKNDKPLLELKIDVSKSNHVIDINQIGKKALKKGIVASFDKYFSLVTEINNAYQEAKDYVIECENIVSELKSKYDNLKYYNITLDIDIKKEILLFISMIAFHAYYKLLFPKEYEITIKQLKFIFDLYRKYNNDIRIITPYNLEEAGDIIEDSIFDRCYYHITNELHPLVLSNNFIDKHLEKYKTMLKDLK